MNSKKMYRQSRRRRPRGQPRILMPAAAPLYKPLPDQPVRTVMRS